MMNDVVFSVSDFVAVLNQTLEYAYPSVTIIGELANFRVSKNRWVYFDLKDEDSSVRFFGSVHQLPGPLEDGLMLQVRGAPRLHPQFGFSVNVQFMSPVGEGSLKKAAALLESRLRAEGIFDEGRKRSVPFPPATIGLITSGESAAYHDFIKVLGERWGGVEIRLADVKVQGEAAPSQIVAAIEYFNTHAQPVDVVVITRGGGSADDLAAFSTESVTRAVAGSRIPTLVAIGHEIDNSLAEFAADLRASTPSNAAQLLVPDKKDVSLTLKQLAEQLHQAAQQQLEQWHRQLLAWQEQLLAAYEHSVELAQKDLGAKGQLLHALSPAAVLARGYAIVRQHDTAVRAAKKLQEGEITIRFADGTSKGTIADITVQ